MPANPLDLFEGIANPENPIIKEISETFVKYQPDVVGVTVMTPKAASAFTIASWQKIQQKLLCCLWWSPCGFEGGGDPKNTKDVDFVVNGEAGSTALNW